MTSGSLSLTLLPVSAGRFAVSERDLEFAFDGDQMTVLENGTPVTSAKREP